MTVKELIELLKCEPFDREVVVRNPNQCYVKDTHVHLGPVLGMKVLKPVGKVFTDEVDELDDSNIVALVIG